MTLSGTWGRAAPWIVFLLAAFLIFTGCAGIEPYEPRNHREEGPEKGLFTGSDGEFTILRKAEEPKNTGEAGAEKSDVSSPSGEEGSKAGP